MKNIGLERTMARSVSGPKRIRKQRGHHLFLRILNILGIGLVIACVLLTFGLVLLQAFDYVRRK